MLKSLLACMTLLLGLATHCVAEKSPNVLVILADDLGFSDLGCYGGEIETPNLDALAAGGLRYSQFYNTARCWPTRAALMTGYYAQQVRRDVLNKEIPAGGRGKRPAWAPLLPAFLKPANYRTYHTGKWHLDDMPIATGFDLSYYMKDQGRYFYPKVHWKNDVKLPPVKPGTDYYITTALGEHAVECLKEHQEKFADQPFFHYLAFTAPHFPLHALPEDIAKYQEIYLQGWDKIRQQRWQRIQDMGLLSGKLSDVERDIGPPYDFPEAFKILGDGEINRPLPWDSLTAEQKEFQAEKMAIHAAMVDRMDQEIGRVLKQIAAMGELDNTLIVFFSDNGASAEIMVRDDGHDPAAPMGSAATYLCLGPGWSNACNTPFRRHKTWVHEGGICTPLVVHWPAGIQAKGELRHQVGHVTDLLPTILDIAGVSKPKTWDDVPIPEAPGTSLVPTFANKPSGRNEFWWLHEGNRAMRVGDWKIVSAKNDPHHSDEWSLYDLKQDRTETHDLKETYPDKVSELKQLWKKRFDEYVDLTSQDL